MVNAASKRGWGFGLNRTLDIGRFLPARLQLPRDVYFWMKAMLLAIVGVQLARIVAALVTPVGPVGQWVPPTAQPLPQAVQTALLTGFDPFGAGGVTIANAGEAAGASEFKLFGTRVAGGGLPGSAILAGPDGEQVSVAVGEDVVPGVRLVAVGFDQAVLERGGQRQTVLMDGESDAGPAPAGVAAASAAPTNGAVTAVRLRENIAFAPRQRAGRVTGLLVSPMGDETVMQAAGLRTGDVIVAVNGRRIGSVADATALQAQVAPGARLSLTVERGSATVPVALNLAGT